MKRDAKSGRQLGTAGHVALDVPCPTCSAKPNVRCTTAKPHQARVGAAARRTREMNARARSKP